MAAPSKRPHEAGDTGFGERCQLKQACIDLSHTDSGESALDRFMRWAECNNFHVSKKVCVGKGGSCAQYGMVAVSDISEGEVLFQIPRPMLLSPQTSAIAELLNAEKASTESVSGWVPLLLSLIYEYHNPRSTWRPYLDLVPDFSEQDLPMFWPRAEMEAELRGTGVVEAVLRDLKSISREFETIVLPFVKKHKTIFASTECESLEFYKKMVAFVMAYSFTEPLQSFDGEESDEEGEITSPPMMIPMADILNHVAKNNAHLLFEKDCLKMVAAKDIKKGEEVFNTYGELPNWQLLQMYGFAEAYPLNHFDTVEVPVRLLVESASDLAVNSADLMEEKKKFLQSLDLIDRGTFVVGREGILTDEELEPILKVHVYIVTMPASM
ncbi:N-lysine methyltransferase setd6-like [Liolophura sinensis]|uniref:N-lysine methyltransferase setd6-like n=1 Tax=Liolophura sinensis TaxID=3198878 RepID=UPI003158A7BD